MSIHILNGDALKAQLASFIMTDVIVMRECLIDGNVQGSTLEEFYCHRANFIAQYEGFQEEDYYQKSVLEFEKIQNIPPNVDIYCWFEHDLFCQTNFWFVIHLLYKSERNNTVYLVKPNTGNEYSFGNMSIEELKGALGNPIEITNERKILLANLWHAYQQKNCHSMLKVVKAFDDELSFIKGAVESEISRVPDVTGLGYPERALLKIMKEEGTDSFANVFRRFSVENAIYSFGDLQVFSMFERLK